jgi:diaminopimelate epimerase
MTGKDRLRLKVWERGAGLTLACGSGACAAGVAAMRRGYAGRAVEVVVEHGTLTIEWMRDGHVMMTGGISLAYKGELPATLAA